MFYHYQLFNKHKLFLRYARYADSIKSPALEARTSEVLFRASSILNDLQTYKDHEKILLRIVSMYHKQIRFPENGRIAVSSQPMFSIYSVLSNILSNLRILQNVSCYFLQAINTAKDYPSSLNDLMKNGIEKYTNNAELQSAFTEYWNNSGKFLKDLRDVDQHHEDLIHNTFYELNGTNGKVVVLLPDNPEAKTSKKFTFEKNINAFDFMHKELQRLSDLYDKLGEKLNLKIDSFNGPSINFFKQGDLEKAQECTIGILLDIVEFNAKDSYMKIDALQINQIIPKANSGNMSVRKMKTDSEENL